MRARLVVVLGLVAAACVSTASPNAAARHDILYVDRATDTAVLDADTGAERIALPAGIATADWSHYWSVEPSGDSTAVHAIDATSAATTRTFSVAGRFALPGVYGAAPSGLSANGQWQFGLYFNPTKGPFIHALNTTQLYAQCILALPDRGAGVRAMWSMVMDAPGGHLYVVNGAAGIVTDVGPTTLA